VSRGAALSAELERVWRGDAEGEAFHGSALHRVLARVSPEVAGARPVPAGHTIREILEHVVAWREWTLVRVRGGKPADLADDGWVALPAPTAAEWSDLLRRARDVEGRVLSTVRGLSDADVDRHGAALRFLLHHDLHHGGQIGLLAARAPGADPP
jgi:uncharacterized damage-inducible protein DinB